MMEHFTLKRCILRFEVSDIVFDLSFDLNDLILFNHEVTRPHLLQTKIFLVRSASSFWQTLANLNPLSFVSNDDTPVALLNNFDDPFRSLNFIPLNPKHEALPQFLVDCKEFIQNNPLRLCSEGVGGTYFVQDSNGSSFAVFKPIDEEPGAPNNPKEAVSQPLLPPGGGAIREVAAFKLDHGFAGVPQTYFLEEVSTSNRGIKTGSVQQFIQNDGESSSVGSSSFITEDVHRIGLLDIRLFNMDRNGENMLLKKTPDNQYHLIPIDHTYILPETLDNAFFEWMYWSQAKAPFSQASVDFVNSIDVEADAMLLRNLGFSELSVQTNLVSTILLKHCVSLGKCLFDISKLICREFPQKPSPLEDLVSQAAALVGREGSDAFYQAFSRLVEQNIH